MIETREQYELFKSAHPISGDVVKTIEALREVARATNDIGLDYEVRLGMWIMNGEPYQAEALHDALDALPDWLLEE